MQIHILLQGMALTQYLRPLLQLVEVILVTMVVLEEVLGMQVLGILVKVQQIKATVEVTAVLAGHTLKALLLTVVEVVLVVEAVVAIILEATAVVV